MLSSRPSLVCAIEVRCRLVPWKSSFICPGRRNPATGRRRRGAVKDKRLVSFQVEVRAKAIEAMVGRKPHSGPVEMVLTLRKESAGEHQSPGGWWAETPDLTNLQKSIEDAIKGVVITDDRFVVATRVVKKYAKQDGCRIAILSLGAAAPEISG